MTRRAFTLELDQSPSVAESYVVAEQPLARALAASIGLDTDQRAAVANTAGRWVKNIRNTASKGELVDAFLQEFGLSTEEGVVLMRLSEALIRTPDFDTAQMLVRDKILAGAWARHAGESDAMLVNLATSGLRLSSGWIRATGGGRADGLAARLGDRVMYAAIVRGMGLMAEHFVLGASIEAAVRRGADSEARGIRHSYDMLGEAAQTMADADRYFASYSHALTHLATTATARASAHEGPGLSVKLSALHPRYELAQADLCRPFLVERLTLLARRARDAGLALIFDAEEADRLELSLDIFGDVITAPGLDDWDGLGIVIQAYQRRAIPVIGHVLGLASAARQRISVRLVKGAYWDSEIKRAQELGLESYPVFTRKVHSDISYLACARKLLDARDIVYPQFATHNANSAAAIIAMAGSTRHFEFQRLHGMGEALHDEVMRDADVPSRVYAPVGEHKDLLPYLVRRLLENGANSSFVNKLMNPEIAIASIVADPVTEAEGHGFTPHPRIPAPRDIFRGTRQSGIGVDLTQKSIAAHIGRIPRPTEAPTAGLIGGTAHGADVHVVRNPADVDHIVGHAAFAAPGDVAHVVSTCTATQWSQQKPAARAAILMRVADQMEAEQDALMALCVAEAGKSWPDAVAELREAVDFCRYYAVEAQRSDNADRLPLGRVACISPWNFPLAIFVGQVAAALAMGNGVIAKPAHQTPLIATEAVRIFHQAGVPHDALILLLGGRDVGAELVSQPGIDAVCFTGSTAAAQSIARGRAAIGKATSPLIAETGGINVMIVDSTALIEQAVRDTVRSAFQSAGQRCSACRIVCVQDDVADSFSEMLAGAMALLRLGDPADLATDIGPVIDAEAQAAIGSYIDQSRTRFRVIGETALPTDQNGSFIAPIAFEVHSVSDVSREIFGPVLHLVRFKAGRLDGLIADIHASGYGLTLGLHTRIDGRVADIAAKAHVGNIYVNRNQVGAVVGVQPFGGEGLSGTGPKAGGPHYLSRLSRNAAAAPISSSINAAEPRPLSDNAVSAIAKLRKAFNDRADGPISTTALPGPTGEENTLSLYPRGLILCAMDGDDRDAHEKRIKRAIAAGNSVLVARSDAVTAKAPAALLQIIDAAAADIARYGAIDGIAADGPMADMLARVAAERDGPILPIITQHDEPSRFAHERTLTINTTAAGGNASLLTLESDDI